MRTITALAVTFSVALAICATPVRAQYAPDPLSVKLTEHAKSLKWPTAPAAYVPTGLNQFKFQLKALDGETYTFDSSPNPVLTTSLLYPRPLGPNRFVFRLINDKVDGLLALYTSFILPSGEMVEPRVMNFTTDGGKTLIGVPGVGILTVRLGGAHPMTEVETATARTMVAAVQQAQDSQTRSMSSPPRPATPGR